MYFCFIESSILSVHHMEPLAAGDARTAALEAKALLAEHDSGVAALVFEGDQQIATIRRDTRGAGRMRGAAGLRSCPGRHMDGSSHRPESPSARNRVSLGE